MTYVSELLSFVDFNKLLMFFRQNVRIQKNWNKAVYLPEAFPVRCLSTNNIKTLRYVTNKVKLK